MSSLLLLGHARLCFCITLQNCAFAIPCFTVLRFCLAGRNIARPHQAFAVFDCTTLGFCLAVLNFTFAKRYATLLCFCVAVPYPTLQHLAFARLGFTLPCFCITLYCFTSPRFCFCLASPSLISLSPHVTSLCFCGTVLYPAFAELSKTSPCFCDMPRC